jgi:hypothetical protein
MINKSLLLTFIILFLTTGMITSGCGASMGILDTNPYDDQPAGDNAYHEQRIEEIRQELLGLSKEEVFKEARKT